MPRNLIRWTAAATIALALPAAASARTVVHTAKPAAKSAPARHHAKHARSAVVHGARIAHVTIPTSTGSTYFVSPTGSDANAGTSASSAWKTVTQADRATLKPGDQVLFQGGQTFADNALMPGWGISASGTSDAPITFGSYGAGQATITKGVWFKGENNLAFQNLTLGSTTGYAGAGFQGDGNGITLLHDTISHANLGINAEGDNWTIANSTITNTGDSGMLLGYSAGEPGDPAGGNHYLVTGNTITNTGLNPADTYGTHGIYDKVTNATITNNTITHFNNDAVSVRYHGSTITGNRIAYGGIGLGWFQYDTTGGSSKWTNNSISNVTAAGIFVAGTKEGSRAALESFQISANTISHDTGDGMNLQPTTGTYSVSHNTTA